MSDLTLSIESQEKPISPSLDIASPSVMYIIMMIKAIQKRMKDPDLINAEYIRVYDILGKEFTNFFDNYTAIFTKVIRGESLATLASALYYKDKIAKGLTSENELSEALANKYLPDHLKKEADVRIKELKEQGKA